MNDKLSKYKNDLKSTLSENKLNESNETFLNKIKNIKSLIENSKSKIVTEKEDTNLEDKGDFMDSVDSLINGMPTELMNIVNEEIEFCLQHECSPEEMKNRVERVIGLLKLAYKDPRSYLEMYGRQYHEMLLGDYIKDICEMNSTEADWYRVARFCFDLQGLKTVNSFGTDGRKSGNELLEKFTNILEKGETVQALREMKINVQTSAEGGDDFGWILYAPFDLRKAMPLIEDMLISEIESCDVKDLINFESKEVSEYLNKFGITEKSGHFEMGICVGSVTLGEIVSSTETAEECKDVVKDLVGQMFRTAHMRCLEDKNIFKEYLKKSNPALYALLGRDHIDILEEKIGELSIRE